MRRIRNFLAIALIPVMILALASCKGRNDYYTVGSATYEICRGESGGIVMNDKKEICVYVLSENRRRLKNDAGEDITEYIPFDGRIINDRHVETAEMSFTLPDGFTASDSDPDVYVRPEVKGEIFIELFPSRGSADMVTTVLAENERLLETYGGDQFSYDQYSILTADSKTVTAISRECKSTEYYVSSGFYFIETAAGAYRITCNSEAGSNCNFDSFVRSVSFSHG